MIRELEDEERKTIFQPLDGLLVAGRNEVEVKVVPALRDRFIGYGRHDPQYKNFKGRENMLLATGLMGPARGEVVSPVRTR